MLLRTALVMALTLTAHSSPVRVLKQPWEWSDEERIAARVDPAARLQRVASYHGREGSARAEVRVDGAQQSEPLDSLVGRDHPELFLASELLEVFIRNAYSFGNDEPALHLRAEAAHAATEAGLPPDFLQVLERETAEIARLHEQEVALRERLARGGTESAGAWDRIVRLVAQQCPLRTAAIKRLRATYGPAFDRFMYEAIAPNVWRTYHGPPPTAAELRRVAEGCQ